jgi:hypothetical protein
MLLTVALVPVAVGAVLARVPLAVTPNATRDEILDALRTRHVRVSARARVAKRLTYACLLLLVASALIEAVPSVMLTGFFFGTLSFGIVWIILWTARGAVENDIEEVAEGR